MSENSKQRSEPQSTTVFCGEAVVWTPRMLAALGNGVKGGKWHSLMDKVYAPATLDRAWRKVRVNKGAGGVDAMSISKFELQQTLYLQELHDALKQQRYHVQAVKRVMIPKADGSERPLGIPTVKRSDCANGNKDGAGADLRA